MNIIIGLGLKFLKNYFFKGPKFQTKTIIGLVLFITWIILRLILFPIQSIIFKRKKLLNIRIDSFLYKIYDVSVILIKS